MPRPTPGISPYPIPDPASTILWDHSVGNPSLHSFYDYAGPMISCLGISVELPTRYVWTGVDPAEQSDTSWIRDAPSGDAPGDYRINPVDADPTHQYTQYIDSIVERPYLFGTKYPALPSSVIAYHDGVSIPIVAGSGFTSTLTNTQSKYFQISTTAIGDSEFDHLGTFYVSYIPMKTVSGGFAPYPVSERANISPTSVTTVIQPVTVLPYIGQIMDVISIIERALGLAVTRWPLGGTYRVSRGLRGQEGTSGETVTEDLMEGCISTGGEIVASILFPLIRKAVLRIYTKVDQILSFTLPRPTLPLPSRGNVIVIELIEAYTYALTDLVGVIYSNSTAFDGIRW